MDWIFLGFILGSIAYLAIVIVKFLESYRESRERIEQSLIDLRRIEDQLSESEHARLEAESRTAQLEEEALKLEHQVSELQQKINATMPRETPARS